jgi:peptidoglycan hydrolase CwlO-like protein
MTQAPASHPKRTNPAAAVLAFLLVFLGLAVLVVVLATKVHRLNAQVADTQKQLTQAKAEASQAQAQVRTQKAQLTEVQAQLQKSQAQAADLQTQLDKAKATGGDLQAQVDRDKAQQADLQAQLNKSQAQGADLQGQLNQATAGSRQLLTQLDQANIQSLDLRSRLQKAESDLAQLQPLLLKTRHLPVTTALERGQGGYVLHVNNLYLQPLSVNVTSSGPGGTRSQSNVIGGGATLNVDKLAAGDQVVVASEGYDPVKVPVP